jgi:curved DNA-binding protein CbpA
MRISSTDARKDLYKALGVSSHATTEEIRKAYKKLIKHWHPDRYPPERRPEAEVKIKEINMAATILLHDERRTTYNQLRARHTTVPNQTAKPQRKTKSKAKVARQGWPYDPTCVNMEADEFPVQFGVEFDFDLSRYPSLYQFVKRWEQNFLWTLGVAALVTVVMGVLCMIRGDDDLQAARQRARVDNVFQITKLHFPLSTRKMLVSERG